MWDLKIEYTEDEALRDTLAQRCVDLGFTGIAWNLTVPQSQIKKCAMKPGKIVERNIQKGVARNITFDPSKRFRQIFRITICVDRPQDWKRLPADIISTYDLIAYRPMNEEAFHRGCANLERLDLISIDLGSRLPYFLRHNHVQSALGRGLNFEICLGDALQSNDHKARWLSNTLDLVQRTRGKGIILSSGASHPRLIRQPFDLINIGSFLRMDKERALATLTSNCEMILSRIAERASFRSILVDPDPESRR